MNATKTTKKLHPVATHSGALYVGCPVSDPSTSRKIAVVYNQPWPVIQSLMNGLCHCYQDGIEFCPYPSQEGAPQ